MDSLLAEIKLHGIILIVVSIVYLTAVCARDAYDLQDYAPATPESYRRATLRAPDDDAGPPRARLIETLAELEGDE